MLIATPQTLHLEKGLWRPRLQVQDFVDSIREERPPAVTGNDGLAAIELIDTV